MANSFVVVLGQTSSEVGKAVAEATKMAGAEMRVEPCVDSFASEIDANRPLAAVIALDTPHARNTAIAMRSRCPSLEIPLIGVGGEVTDLTYEEAYSSGIDDICGLDARRLGRRLRNLCDVGPVTSTGGAKSVLIVDDDRTMRLLIGRVFRDAGYTVQFASDAEDALARVSDPAINVVVCSAAIDATGDEPLSRRAPTHGSRAAWIINTPPKQMPAVRARLGLGSDVKVAVHDAFQSPATLLFVANELMNRPAVDGRKSERLLYGAKVWFRHAGRDDIECGYLYNISGGGVYVRTLAPPQRWDEMWLEFVPPRSDRIVHLEGTAVWTRPFGPGGNATVPCGFGLQITGGSQADMLRYGRCYRTFLAERIAERLPQGTFDEHGELTDLPSLPAVSYAASVAP
jgi:hypothetical protein